MLVEMINEVLQEKQKGGRREPEGWEGGGNKDGYTKRKWKKGVMKDEEDKRMESKMMEEGTKGKTKRVMQI